MNTPTAGQHDSGEYRLISVFDTSTIIGAGESLMDALVKAERDAGVLGFASVWPTLELLARCSEADTVKARRAHSALRRVVGHASDQSSSHVHLRVHEAGEFAVAKSVFNMTPHEPLLETEFVSDLLVTAAFTQVDEFRTAYGVELQQVADRVRSEKAWFTHMATIGMNVHSDQERPRSPPTPTDLAIVAAGFVQAMGERYGISSDAVDLGRAASLVAYGFPVAMAFMYGLLSDSNLLDGVAGGANSAWDLKIAFHASRAGNVSGAPVILVSDDRRLLRAAREAGEEARVIRLADYQSMLASSETIADRLAKLSGRSGE